MALIPIQDYANDNPYGFSVSKLLSLAKTKPGADKILRRISDRTVLVDEESLEEWMGNQKFYSVKRTKKEKKQKI